MEQEERIARLETAHRALAAQHLALQTICRAVLPLIAVHPKAITHSLQAVGAATRDALPEDEFDAEFRAEVEEWIGILGGEIQLALKPALTTH